MIYYFLSSILFILCLSTKDIVTWDGKKCGSGEVMEQYYWKVLVENYNCQDLRTASSEPSRLA